jgi:hypothetical protein
MRRLLCITGLAALLVALVPTAGFAKGPVEVSIAGPGGDGPIHMGGEPGSGEPGSGARLSRLAEHAGLLTVGFGQGVSQLEERRPDGELGPEYRLEWSVPGPKGTDTVVQRLYPYADGGAVTHTEAGQPYMGMETFGGWYVGGSALSDALTEAGVPAEPPARDLPVVPVVLGVAVCALVLLALWAVRVARHRAHAVAT